MMAATFAYRWSICQRSTPPSSTGARRPWIDIPSRSRRYTSPRSAPLHRADRPRRSQLADRGLVEQVATDDGSYTVWFGPATCPARGQLGPDHPRPELVPDAGACRPLEPWFDKTWRPSEIGPV